MKTRGSDRRGRPERQADHGPHTLRVWEGTIVGIDRNDVFVELGVRMQGVIALDKFAERPAIGDVFEFTLRGQEESLWVLALRDERSLVSWEQMRPGAQVEARVVRRAPGGLQLKVGPLHAFMPRSHTGLARAEDPGELVGRTFACEVLEVDPERQRVLLSRKLVLQRERASEQQREISALRPGAVVEGHVTRIEPYGAFVQFGRGLSGLIHVSNLARERVAHAGDVLRKGQSVKARVLSVLDHGRRIALGLKQMEENPWARAAERYPLGGIAAGEVTRVTEYGVFVALEPGVEGWVPRSETGVAQGRGVGELLMVGQPVSVRVREIDVERERLSLSLLHGDGARIAPEEAEGEACYRELVAHSDSQSVENPLGRALREALERSVADA